MFLYSFVGIFCVHYNFNTIDVVEIPKYRFVVVLLKFILNICCLNVFNFIFQGKKIEAFVVSFKMFNLIKQQTCYLLSKFMSLAWQVHRHFQSNSIFYGSKRNEAPAFEYIKQIFCFVLRHVWVDS